MPRSGRLGTNRSLMVQCGDLRQLRMGGWKLDDGFTLDFLVLWCIVPVNLGGIWTWILPDFLVISTEWWVGPLLSTAVSDMSYSCSTNTDTIHQRFEIMLQNISQQRRATVQNRENLWHYQTMTYWGPFLLTNCNMISLDEQYQCNNGPTKGYFCPKAITFRFACRSV